MARETASEQSGGGTNRIRITIDVEENDDGSWKAFEPASDSDLYGRGENPRQAVANYALALEGGQDAEAVEA